MAPKSNAKSSSAGAGKRTLSLSKNDQALSAAASSGDGTGAAAGGAGGGGTKDVHPLRLSWLFWFVHRTPGAKVVSASQYEESIKKIGGFASIESFWTVWSHLLPPSELPPVTDILLFSSSIRLPIWEELPRGAKFTIRLRKGIANRLWEDLVLASIGDQFSADEGCDGVVGVVLSVRAQEDVLSVWTEKSYGDGGRAVKEAIFRLLGLPSATVVDYKLNSDLIHSTSRPTVLERSHSMRNGDDGLGSRSRDL